MSIKQPSCLDVKVYSGGAAQMSQHEVIGTGCGQSTSADLHEQTMHGRHGTGD